MSNTSTVPHPNRIYQHHKGGLYKVLMLGKDEATQAQVVIYCPKGGGQIWVRPAAEFQPPRFVEVVPVTPDKPWERFFKPSELMPEGRGETVFVKLAAGHKLAAGYDKADHTWKCHEWDNAYFNHGQLLTEVVEWRYPAGK